MRRTGHVDAIEAHLAKLNARMNGLTYRPRDVWEHVEAVADDPQTVISLNPPTYKGGFEKFYDTGGRLSWAVPEYEVFDAQVDVFRLMDRMKGRKALILCQQQQTPGNPADWPVYARHLSPGQYVYVCTNRPQEVLEVAGGMKVAPLKPVELHRLNLPTLPREYPFTPDSQVELMIVGAKEAAYYRDLWMHKLDGKSAAAYVAVSIDGFLAGLFAYDSSAILRPYHPKRKTSLILTFAVGAPHVQRTTRLITMIALAKATVDRVNAPHIAALTKEIVTTEMTKYPEAKGLRGLMKLDTRKKHPKYGYQLVYVTTPTTKTYPELLAEWVRKEARWQTVRPQQIAAEAAAK